MVMDKRLIDPPVRIACRIIEVLVGTRPQQVFKID